MPPAIADHSNERRHIRATFAIIRESIDAVPYCEEPCCNLPVKSSTAWKTLSPVSPVPRSLVRAQAPPIPRVYHEYLFMGLFVFIATVLLFAFLVAFKDCLQWLEHQSPWVLFCSCTFLYLLLSLPLAFGYILLNLATGYLCGLLFGLLTTAVTVAIGNTAAFVLMRAIWGPQIRQMIKSASQKNPLIRSACDYMTHPTWNDVALMRLLPVPFGLQNAIFVASDLDLETYTGATFLGLLPTQILNVALGSRLRSMRDVLTGKNVSAWEYIIYVAQIASLFLVVFVITSRAKKRLHNAGSDKHHLNSPGKINQSQLEDGTVKNYTYRDI